MSILQWPEIGARQAVGLTAMAAVAAARAAEKAVRRADHDQMGQRPVEERQKGLRHPDRGRAGPGIRYAGLAPCWGWLQRRSPGGRLAGGLAGRGGALYDGSPAPGARAALAAAFLNAFGRSTAQAAQRLSGREYRCRQVLTASRLRCRAGALPRCAGAGHRRRM